MRRGRLRDVSSTENTGDRTQQATAAPDERPEAAVVEVGPVDEGPLAATPDAAVPDVTDPAVSEVTTAGEPTVEAPQEDGSAAPDVPAVTELAPVDEGPLGATPDAVVPDDADSTTVPDPTVPDATVPDTTMPAADSTPVEAPASQAVTPDAGTPAAESPADAALADPTTDAASTDAPTTDDPAAAGSTPSAAPVPGGGRHSAGSRRGGRGRPAPEAQLVVPAVPPSDPTQWGRVDEEGTVFVRTPAGERPVGSWQAGEPAAGLAHYGRRFDDLATEVALLEARLAAHTGNPGEIKTKAEELADQILTASAVGDLDHLALRARAMVSMAETAVAANRAEKAKARAEQIARKEALAAEAEQIAADSTQWKSAGDRLKAIVEEWKAIKGIDRKTDEALWQRFAAARDAFGRRRGAHFAELDKQRSEARAAKSELIAEAERLSSSTEWGPTSADRKSTRLNPVTL